MNRYPLLLLTLLLLPSSASAAKPDSAKRLSGDAAALDREMDARSAPMGKIVRASAAFASLSLPKDALLRAAFIDVGRIVKAKEETSFVGRHATSQGFDFALVRFPGAVDISTSSAAEAVGTIEGSVELTGVGGQKVTVPVISARLVGVLDGGTLQPNGLLLFAPKSPLRVYQRKSPAKKASSRPTAPR